MLVKRTFSICSVLGALILFMGAGVGQSYAEEGEVVFLDATMPGFCDGGVDPAEHWLFEFLYQ